MKILILGGYGVFGGRLAELLADLNVDLLIAGRRQASADAFCAGYRGTARTIPLALDRCDIAAALATYCPDLVIDASGPFQDYGADRYRAVEACIAAHTDYLDFADAADFVFGVAQFDDAARAAGVFVLSGVSSFPVLTAAVLAELAKTMTIRTVAGGIAPSPYAGIGLNVMRAVLGYAGAPVRLVRDGQAGQGVGLAESARYTVAVPGRLPLPNLRYSLVDVPDLRVLPPLHPGVTDIWMGAGPVPEILHRLLNLLAKLRWWLRLPSFAPAARLCYRVLNRMRFGEHRGGMFVHATGTVDGQSTTRSWHLLAEGDDGPYIPSMAIEGIVRGLLADRRPAPGARSGAGELDLSAYDRLFENRAIFTGWRSDEPIAPLYRRLLGSAFVTLPPRVQSLHDSTAPRRWSGHATVRRGKGLLARAIAAVMGFPQAATAVPVTVAFTPGPHSESWVRDFAGQRFTSRQSSGTGRDTHLLVERFGFVSVALALVVEGDRLYLIPRRWSLLGLPLARALLPRGTSFETERGGEFCFDVEISVPLIGLIVAYSGTLQPEHARYASDKAVLQSSFRRMAAE